MGNKSNKNNKNNKIEDKTLFKNIKSNFLLEQIFSNIKENQLLKIIKYNKSLQQRLNKNINDYINYYKIIIEIIPKGQKNIFLLIIDIMISHFIIFFLIIKKKK